MKAIELRLRSGEKATFFLHGNFNLLTRKIHYLHAGSEEIAVLDDGTHGNGGYELKDSYEEVRNRLAVLLELEL